MAPVSDKILSQKVSQRLERSGSGSSQSKVTATVSKGEVTLRGTLQYEMQRAPIVRAMSSVDGVRRVIDQLTVAPKVKKWG